MNAAVKHNAEESILLKLPDSILILILSFVDTITLVSVSKVSKRCYMLANDGSLSKTFDALQRSLTLKQLWSIAHKKLVNTTTGIHLRGKTSVTKIMEHLSIPYLQNLYKRCPNISKLSLHCFDLRDLDLALLPKKLSYLSLEESMLPMDFFTSLKSNFSLPNLKVLKLSNCTKVSNNDLEAISYLKSLELIDLCNCYRISARGIPGLTINLINLMHVNFSKCPAVNDVVLYHLSKLSLKTLILQYCHLITSRGIEIMFSKSMGNSLQYFDLFSCHELNDEILDIIKEKTSCLVYLDISECHKLTVGKVNQLRRSMKNCDIIFSASHFNHNNASSSSSSSSCVLNDYDHSICCNSKIID